MGLFDEEEGDDVGAGVGAAAGADLGEGLVEEGCERGQERVGTQHHRGGAVVSVPGANSGEELDERVFIFRMADGDHSVSSSGFCSPVMSTGKARSIFCFALISRRV